MPPIYCYVKCSFQKNDNSFCENGVALKYLFILLTITIDLKNVKENIKFPITIDIYLSKVSNRTLKQSLHSVQTQH